MTPSELVHHISSGTTELFLDFPLSRRRTRSNLGFDDFLELQSNDTLRVVKCATHIKLGISVDNWARLVVAIEASGASQICIWCYTASRVTTQWIITR
jgi:hypothetical protein